MFPKASRSPFWLSSRAYSRSLAFLVVLVGALLASTASARRNGVAISGCEGCHGLPEEPATFSFSSDPATFSPGDTVTLELTISAPNMAAAGFYLKTTEGTLATISGEHTQLLSGNIAHDTPIPAANGSATVRMSWTAPNEIGGTDFELYFLAANGDNNRGGDRAGYGTASLVYGCSGTTFYEDFDRDGVGSSNYGTTVDCEQPEGYAALDGDCNENNAQVFPGQTEVCNERDDDCDGEVDEGTSPRDLYPDEDGDGFGVFGETIVGCVPPEGYADNADDCDDRDPMVNPDAMEVCNGRDDNCNQRTDEEVRIRCGVGLCERYGISCFSDECHPGDPIPELCNGLDDDCDGVVDNNADCPAGQECYMFQCINADDADLLREGSADGPGPAPSATAPPPNAGTPPANSAAPPLGSPVTDPNSAGGCGLAGSASSTSSWLSWIALAWLALRRRQLGRD